MRDKAIVFILLALIMLPAIAPAVKAEDMLGGMGQNIIDTVIKIANFEISFPAASVYGYSTEKAQAPVWMFVFMFMIIFTIIWLASAQVPLFKDEENKGPRKAFAIAFAFLIMLGTPAVPWMYQILSVFTALAFVAMIVLGVYTIWVIFRGGWASNRKAAAAASQSMADAKQRFAEAGRQVKQTDEYERKTKQASKTGLKNQVSNIKATRRDLEDVLSQLRRLQQGRGTTILGNSRTSRILRDLDRIRKDIGKILSFQTDNDRLLSTMTNTNYNETATPGSIGSSTSGLIDVKKDSDTQTNDLGRLLGGIADTIRTQGITIGATGNIGHLVDVTVNAISILNRMERDIVLEEQMVEKI